MDGSSSGPKTFGEDVQLFACKLIDEKILNFTEFDKLVEVVPSGASLLDFAQQIIDADICEDLEKVQQVLDAACRKRCTSASYFCELSSSRPQ